MSPPNTLQLHVNSPLKNVELLSFPFNAEDAFNSVQNNPCIPSPFGFSFCSVPEPGVPSGKAIGIIHQGDDHTFGIGSLLSTFNGQSPEAMKSLYMRQHGLCETEVPWSDLLGAILSQAKGEGGCSGDTIFGCFNWSTKLTRRVETSYLRRAGVNGRGGFGLYLEGLASFSSPFLDDLSFAAKAGYDVTLDDSGHPAFTVSAGPYTRTWDCSPSPFTTCQDAKVSKDLTDSLRDEVPSKLN